MVDILILLALLAIGYTTGRYLEKKHFQELIEREKKLHHIAVISGEWKDHIENGQEGKVFGGGVVIASDYFKTFVSGLRSLVGGRLTSFESLLDRGRREAIVRMKEKAAAWGAEKVINVRIETATISGKGASGMPCVELYAYGTAIRNGQQKPISQ